MHARFTFYAKNGSEGLGSAQTLCCGGLGKKRVGLAQGRQNCGRRIALLEKGHVVHLRHAETEKALGGMLGVQAGRRHTELAERGTQEPHNIDLTHLQRPGSHLNTMIGGRRGCVEINISIFGKRQFKFAPYREIEFTIPGPTIFHASRWH